MIVLWLLFFLLHTANDWASSDHLWGYLWCNLGDDLWEPEFNDQPLERDRFKDFVCLMIRHLVSFEYI